MQETLVIPLYGRKMCSELYPSLYRDETALRLIDQIDYDFSLLSEKSKSLMQQFSFLEAAMRQNDLMSWFRRIDASGGAVFFAAGVFYYFLTEQVQALVQGMAEAFPGGRLVFDAANQKAVRLMLTTWIRTAEIQDVGAYFAVSDAKKELSGWSPRLRVSSRGYMLGYCDCGYHRK